MSDPSPSNCSPVRVTLSRRKGWRIPPNTIKVCRPGMWGNPFNVDGERTTEQAVIMYEAWLGGADWDSWLWSKHRKHWLRTQNAACRLRALLDELRGKNLACWCGQKSPCHAAVLLRLANVEITNDQAEVRVIEADDDRVTSKCQQARAWLFGASGCSARAREWPLNAINPESEAAHT